MQQYNQEIQEVLSTQKEIKVYYTNIAGNSISSSIELISLDERKRLKDSAELETYLDQQFNPLRSQ
jgi:hypothetical protein